MPDTLRNVCKWCPSKTRPGHQAPGCGEGGLPMARSYLFLQGATLLDYPAPCPSSCDSPRGTELLPVLCVSHAPGCPIGSCWSWTWGEATFSLGFILCLVLFPLVFSPWGDSLMHPNSCFRLCLKGTQRKIMFLLRKMNVQMSERILQIISENSLGLSEFQTNTVLYFETS